MKTIKYLLIVALAITVTSCKKTFYEDVNTNDNLPLDVPIYALVPGAEAQLAFGQYGDASRYTSVFMQYVTGGYRQFASYDRYSMTENDFDNFWRLNLYAGPMEDFHLIIEKAKAGGNTYYQGIGNIMMAYSLGLATDLFGDIPYSEAFQGSAQLQPKFDTQQEVYASIQKLLDDGMALLNGADDSPFQPGAEDLIYGGDNAKWIAFANGLKARFYIHLSKRDANYASNALAAIAAGALTSSADDAVMPWGDTDPTSNPWYQYIRDRDDIIYDGYCVQSMQTKNDPRYGSYIDVNGDYWGPGYLGVPFTVPNAATPFFSYVEQLFISAEAKLATGDDAGAQADLASAVTETMNKYAISYSDDSLYQATNVIWTGTNAEKLALIMNEKYVAMYLQPEAWTDWRRTGYPALTPNANGVINQIPRRFTYPNSERLYNTNCPQTSSLVSPRLWLDN